MHHAVDVLYGSSISDFNRLWPHLWSFFTRSEVSEPAWRLLKFLCPMKSGIQTLTEILLVVRVPLRIRSSFPSRRLKILFRLHRRIRWSMDRRRNASPYGQRQSIACQQTSLVSLFSLRPLCLSWGTSFDIEKSSVYYRGNCPADALDSYDYFRLYALHRSSQSHLSFRPFDYSTRSRAVYYPFGFCWTIRLITYNCIFVRSKGQKMFGLTSPVTGL